MPTLIHVVSRLEARGAAAHLTTSFPHRVFGINRRMLLGFALRQMRGLG